jgi:hypothetical protein
MRGSVQTLAGNESSRLGVASMIHPATDGARGRRLEPGQPFG